MKVCAFAFHCSRLRRASAAWFLNRFISALTAMYFCFQLSRLRRKNRTRIRGGLFNVETSFDLMIGVLQSGGGVSFFVRKHRGEAFATAMVMARMTRAFVASVERFANQCLLDVQKLDRDPVVLAVLSSLLIFRLLPRGFSNRELRDHVAQLLVRAPDEFTPGQMTYHLRRLRLKGLIARVAGTHRYKVTEAGLRAALFYTGSHSAVIRPLGAAMQTPHDQLQQRLLASIRQLIRKTRNTTAA